MFVAMAFLDTENAFDNTWHLGLLYKLSKSFGKSNQAYYLFSFSEKILSLSQR
jgi:hypothetical protein